MKNLKINLMEENWVNYPPATATWARKKYFIFGREVIEKRWSKNGVIWYKDKNEAKRCNNHESDILRERYDIAIMKNQLYFYKKINKVIKKYSDK